MNCIAHTLLNVILKLKTEDQKLVLLHEPKDAGYYGFYAKDYLALTNKYPRFTSEQIKKSSHADTYFFDFITERSVSCSILLAIRSKKFILVELYHRSIIINIITTDGGD